MFMNSTVVIESSVFLQTTFIQESSVAITMYYYSIL